MKPATVKFINESVTLPTNIAVLAGLIVLVPGINQNPTFLQHVRQHAE